MVQNKKEISKWVDVNGNDYLLKLKRWFYYGSRKNTNIFLTLTRICENQRLPK